jgi:hypothetical protein
MNGVAHVLGMLHDCDAASPIVITVLNLTLNIRMNGTAPDGGGSPQKRRKFNAIASPTKSTPVPLIEPAPEEDEFSDLPDRECLFSPYVY